MLQCKVVFAEGCDGRAGGGAGRVDPATGGERLPAGQTLQTRRATAERGHQPPQQPRCM